MLFKGLVHLFKTKIIKRPYVLNVIFQKMGDQVNRTPTVFKIFRNSNLDFIDLLI